MPDIDRTHAPADNPPGLAGAEPERNTAGGTKHSAQKPPLHLIPRAAMIAEAEVLAFGAKKYAEWNWSKGLKWADAARAAIGHLYAFLDREDKDPESGLQHVAHARAETGFLLEFIARGTGEDDRRPAPVPTLRKPVGAVVSVQGDTAVVDTAPAVGSREWAWAMLVKSERVTHRSWVSLWLRLVPFGVVGNHGRSIPPGDLVFWRTDSDYAHGWSIVRQDDSGTAHPAQTVAQRT